MGKRATRTLEFLNRGSMVTISTCTDTVTSAVLLLDHARREIPSGVQYQDGGHYAAHGPAAIVLICTAFDQWLNESCFSLHGPFQGLLKIAAAASTVDKYYSLGAVVHGKPLRKNADLEAAYDVRNEIVHLLPRQVNHGATWPAWLRRLERNHLVLAAPPPVPASATPLTTKLHSYKLARWTFEVMAQASEDLLAAFPPTCTFERDLISWTAQAFTAARQLPP